MARSLGIHLRPDGYAYALVDGNARKWSLGAHGEGGLAPDESDLREALAAALGDALKGGGLGKLDQVTVAVPSTDTVLRELSLPFSDREKIQQVLKFEVESDLYHLDIDEVVCDYLELADDRATATLLVGALPKSQIETAIDVLEDAGQDPAVLDLDLGALATAVRTVEAAPELPAGFQAFLYVGSYSSVLLVAGEEGVRAVRKIPIGWRELGRGLADEGGPEAGLDEMEVAAEPLEGEEGAEQEAAPPVDPDDLMLFGADSSLPLHGGLAELLERAPAENRAAFQRRMVAEVRRGLTAMAGVTVSRLHLLGAAVPGLAEALASRLGHPTAPLALGGADEDGAPDAAALGAALRGLGLAGSEMNFRQEEFRQTGGLERLEGPLTLMLVGLIAFFLVDSVILFKRTRDVLVHDTEAIYQECSKEVDALNTELREGDPETWFIKGVEGLDLDDLQRIQTLRGRVKKARAELDEMVGEGDLVHPQSCLEAWRLVFGVLERELEEQYEGRWMLESLDFTSIQPRRKEDEPYVEVKIELTVFGDPVTASSKFDELLSAFRVQDFVVGSPSYAGEISAAEGVEARVGTVVVRVSTAKGIDS
jgi:hypothetical protein